MKEKFLDRVMDLQRSMIELKEAWNKMDWSRVPVQVSEHYPFHQDLNEMIAAVETWIETIKKS